MSGRLNRFSLTFFIFASLISSFTLCMENNDNYVDLQTYLDNPGGVHIYRSTNSFRADRPIYASLLKKLFFEARNKQYLFLPKFGRNDAVEFFQIVIHAFADFIRQHHESKLHLALVIFEPDLIKAMALRAEVIKEEKFRVDNAIDRFANQENQLSNDLATIGTRMTWNQGNLLHVFHTLRFSEQYMNFSAIFVPMFGDLAKSFEEFKNSRATYVEPVDKTNIAALISSNYFLNSDVLAGDQNAPSTLSSFAQFLSPHSYKTYWPEIVMFEAGIRINEFSTKVKAEYLPVLNNFDVRQCYIFIPYQKLQGVFKILGFQEKINGMSTTAYSIIHSRRLSSMGTKYRAIYHMVGPFDSGLRVPDFLHAAFADPLSQKIMANPAQTPDGNNYEKEIIAHWAALTHKDPFSLEYLDPDMLIENTRLKDAIAAVHNASMVQEHRIVLQYITPELLSCLTQIVSARETDVKDINYQRFLEAMLPYLERQKQNDSSIQLLIQRIKNLDKITLVDHSNEQLILGRDVH